MDGGHALRAWPTLRNLTVDPLPVSAYTSAMIVDCHAHVFENWHGACGHPTVDIHLKYIQKNVTRPAAKTFRLRDGAPASARGPSRRLSPPAFHFPA
jgi:hypothetical protein